MSGGAFYAPVKAQPAPATLAADVAAVKQLVNELSHARPGSSTQTAQHLSGRLKLLREKMDGGASRNELNKLIHALDDSIASHAAGRHTLAQRVHDQGHSRGAHHGRTLNQHTLQNPGRTYNPAPTQPVSQHDYYTTQSSPGRRPGVGNEAGNIWSGFSQGPTKGNCITVAAIKAAMMKFGQKPADIFNQVRVAGDGYDVEMRDGFRLHLSKSELAQAANVSEFKGSDAAMLADAHFLYAASAKRAQWENNDGYARKSFGHALYSINDSEPDRANGLLRLGLKAHIQITSVANLARGQLGVVTHGVPVNGQMVGHSLAVINGREEVWGRQGGHPPTNIYANALALI
ncbi:hypothetical protein BFW87_30345 [Pseudomonas fluorescens]|uniref:Type III secretion effector protein n=1 Tax=Pseudomonas fluorescens TaxID=294 RepID=A0A1T2XUS8_PSEFL|nr:hypothetical protein BFW87_30345 [Pseudomonas fluorescens]